MAADRGDSQRAKVRNELRKRAFDYAIVGDTIFPGGKSGLDRHACARRKRFRNNEFSGISG